MARSTVHAGERGETAGGSPRAASLFWPWKEVEAEVRRGFSPTRHKVLFEAMLTAVDFKGLCCVNYKVRHGVPIVLEINPRFGFSLAPFFPAFVCSFDWVPGGGGAAR